MKDFNICIKDGSDTLSQFIVEQNTSSIQLYDWQRQAIEFFFKTNKAIFEVTTGAGKTFCSIEILKEVLSIDPDVKILIVVPKNVILEDTWFKELYDNGISLRDIGVYYGKIKEYGKITITNMQNLANIPLELFDAAIFDECFSEDTNIKIIKDNKIIEKNIKEIVLNEENNNVLSYNIKTKKIEKKSIIGWYEIEKKREVIDLFFDNDKKLTVTPEQLIYTNKGYKKAKDITENDNIYYI